MSIKIQTMKNDFMLHIKYFDIDKFDELFKELISQEEFHASMIFARKFKKENEVIYKIKISPTA
jgi:hypothetical protein